MAANKKYSKDDVTKAMLAVRAGSSVRAAAAQFNVPKSTLNDKKKNKYSNPCAGKPAVLSVEEEGEIEKWVLEMAAAGHPVNEEILRISVGQFVKRLEKRDIFTAEVPSRGWITKFMNRHPAISRRTANQLAKKRVVSEMDVRSWFEEVNLYLSSKNMLDLINEPTRVFNMDESAFQMAPNQRKKVFAGREHKNVQAVQGNSNRESYTVLMAGSASGLLVPPLILFPYKERLPREIVSSVPRGWGVGKTDKGWMNSGSFYEYLANVFYPWLIEERITLPVIIFVDGHRSHVTYETVQFCKERNIILISLPPNSTHFIQPLDVSFFKPMKAAWDSELTKWRFENGGAMIARRDFAPLLKKSIDRMNNIAQTLSNGFRKCGLVPWNVDAIDYASLPKPQAIDSSIRENIPLPEIADTPSFSLPSSIFLRELVKRIPSNLVEEFETQQRNLFWTGSPDASLLFDLWRNVKEEINGPVDYFEIDPALLGLEISTENTWQEVEDNHQLADLRPANDPHPFELDANDNQINEDNTYESIDIPLEEEEEIVEEKMVVNRLDRSGKRTVPAVATSESWEEYYQAQDEVKRMAELTKRRKLEERQEKAKAREEEKAARLMISKQKAELRKKEKERKMVERKEKMLKKQEQKQKPPKKSPTL